MDLARLIRRRVQESGSNPKRVRRTPAPMSPPPPTSAARGGSTAVYSDDDVTIVQRDGHTEVFHHGADRPDDSGGADSPDGGEAGGGLSSRTE